MKVVRFSSELALHGGLEPYLESERRVSKFERVVGLIEGYYVDSEPLEAGKLYETALGSMVKELDPYSEYMNKETLSSLQEDTSQEFGGIGVQVESKDGFLTVVAPIEGTPGARAGLLRGDRIVEVDGEDIRDMSLGDAVAVLRGEPGSEVELTMYRPRSEEEFKKQVVREKIGVESVRGVAILDEQIGYLRIVQFGEKTAEEVAVAISSLSKQGMRGLVMDLRNNPGGLLDAAVAVVEPFLEKDELILYTEGRREETNEKWYSKNDDEPYDFKLAILINSGSASAAEIVTGALKDHGVATVIGETSFGKGSVQRVIDLGDGSGLKLTVAKYYTPGKYVIHEHGIEPNIVIETTVDEDKQLAIQQYGLAVMSREEFIAQYEFEPIEDRQLNAALGELKSELNPERAEGVQ